MSYNTDFYGKMPGWSTKWGIYLISSFFLIILLFSAFIEYNEIERGEVTITSVSPPINIKSKRSGQLINLLKQTGDTVFSGQHIAILKSPASYEDVQFIKRSIKQDTVLGPDTNLFLGNLQDDYAIYINSLTTLKSYKKFKRNQEDFNLYTNQFISKKNEQQQLKINIETVEKKLNLSQNNHSRMITLEEKGVISKSELELSEKDLLSQQQELLNMKKDLSNTNFFLSQSKQKAINSNLDDNQELEKLLNGYNLQKEILLGKIQKWEIENIISSPIAGRLSFIDVWSNYQNIKENEHIFTIVPPNEKKYIGISRLPLNKSGKLKEGLKTYIKLDNFPYEEWGTLTGTISYISEVPKKDENNNYIAYISLDNLTTSYDKKIKFSGSLTGQCDIIIEGASLFERLVFNLRKISIQ